MTDWTGLAFQKEWPEDYLDANEKYKNDTHQFHEMCHRMFNSFEIYVHKCARAHSQYFALIYMQNGSTIFQVQRKKKTNLF